jgi:hypothetical protein
MRFKTAKSVGLAAGSIGVIALLTLGLPATAFASAATYYSGSSAAGTWHSSYDRSNQNCINDGSWINGSVKSVGVTSTTEGPHCMTYALQVTWEYCRSSPFWWCIDFLVIPRLVRR